MAQPKPMDAFVDVHGSYRAGRTRHEPPDALISDVVTQRTLGAHLARSSLFLLALIVLSLSWSLVAMLFIPAGVVWKPMTVSATRPA